MPQNIISLANAMYSPAPLATNNKGNSNSNSVSLLEASDRLDAARALLGVSPLSEAAAITADLTTRVPEQSPYQQQHDQDQQMPLVPSSSTIHVVPVTTTSSSLPLPSSSSSSTTTSSRRDRSDSAGLDALAFLASKEATTTTTSNSTSTSNRPSSSSSSSLTVRWETTSATLEREKAAAAAATAVSSSSSSSEDEASTSMPPPPPRFAIATRRRAVSNPEWMERWGGESFQSELQQRHQEHERVDHRLHFVLPTSILEEEMAEASAAMKAKQEREDDEAMMGDRSDDDDEEEEEEIDESLLTPDELLRRARSRLLEDLSEVNMNGDKGMLRLPHSLAKYKEVYNKNGRVGIYTPLQRAAIISRYQDKRTRRVWNKKIRYNCRKNLADRRIRVKGRFVKKEEQAKLAAQQISTIPEDGKFVSPELSEEDEEKNVVMPDVSDPNAGFCPTEEQPYRRSRRHTIT